MKKHLKKLIMGVWALSILVHIFAPLVVVYAAQDLKDIVFTVEDTSKYKIEAIGNDELKVTRLSDNQNRLIQIYVNNEKVSVGERVTGVSCPTENSVCKFTIDNWALPSYTLNYDNSFMDVTESESLISNSTNFSGARNLIIKEHINQQQEQNNEPVSTVDYNVTIELTDNMKQYYELTAGTNVITVTLKNSDPAVTSTIKLQNHQNSTDLTPTVTCNTENDSCTMVAPANTETKLVFNTKHIDLVDYRPEEEPIKNTKTFKVDEPREFDGKAALLWECNGKICYNYSLFQDIHVEEYGTFIAANTITNENTNAGSSSIEFDVHSRVKFFAPYWKFLSRKADIDAAGANIDSFKGEGKIDVAPLNEPNENNAYVSYGNRGFKIIIYGEDYKGITIGELSGLEYYPADWVSWFKRRESFDISGTTKDTPVEMLGYVLQDRINIKKLTYTDYTIESIEAIDVPTGAVVVNDKNDGSYDLVFNSNFYSKVEFKVTDSDGNEYFFVFNRRTTDPYIATEDGGPRAGIVAEVFYDNDLLYTDYTVLAKIQYKDGTTKVVELTGIPYGDDGFGHPVDVIEWDEEDPPIGGDDIPKGRGIKKTKYAYETTKAELKKVDKIYINVERTGSTQEYYTGNFAGSGKGDLIDMKYWEDRLN